MLNPHADNPTALFNGQQKFMGTFIDKAIYVIHNSHSIHIAYKNVQPFVDNAQCRWACLSSKVASIESAEFAELDDRSWGEMD